MIERRGSPSRWRKFRRIDNYGWVSTTNNYKERACNWNTRRPVSMTEVAKNGNVFIVVTTKLRNNHLAPLGINTGIETTKKSRAQSNAIQRSSNSFSICIRKIPFSESIARHQESGSYSGSPAVQRGGYPADLETWKEEYKAPHLLVPQREPENDSKPTHLLKGQCDHTDSFGKNPAEKLGHWDRPLRL